MSVERDNQKRKESPIYEGLFKYFPDALAYVAHVSYVANEKHNPGTPVHWDRSKSADELDAGLRHLLDRTKEVYDADDKLRHLGKAAWRILAALQKEIEKDQAKPAVLKVVPGGFVSVQPCDITHGPCACGAWHPRPNQIIKHY